LVDDNGDVVTSPSSANMISGSVLRNHLYGPIVVKSFDSVSAGKDVFYSVSIGINWFDIVDQHPEKLLSITASSDFGNATLSVQKIPYPTGTWAAVFLKTKKIGVLAMTTQNQPMDTIVNQVVDAVRNAVQITPGQSQRFCASTFPATGATWGTPLAFQFQTVGLCLQNFGASLVEFSFDGINRHGVVAAGSGKFFDFRRESVIYFRSVTSTSEIVVEAW